MTEATSHVWSFYNLPYCSRRLEVSDGKKKLSEGCGPQELHSSGGQGQMIKRQRMVILVCRQF